MTPVLLELAVIVTVCVLSLLGPGLIPVRLTVCVPASSKIVRLVKAVIVGGSLAGLTVSRNELLEIKDPSLAEMVIVLVPNAFVVGVKVTVRFVPAPPNAMFATVTRFVLEEVAEKISESAGVSRSLTVKKLVATPSSFVVTSGMFEIVGGLLTVNTLLNPFVKPDALAVNCLFVPPTSISAFA